MNLKQLSQICWSRTRSAVGPKDKDSLELKARYRNIYILESRAWFRMIEYEYDATTDLVLTTDFGLRKEIASKGGDTFYVDHLRSPEEMEEANFQVYEYFRNWHLDADGADLFSYCGVDFGFSFRIEIWTDLTNYARSRLCLERLRTLKYARLCVGMSGPLIIRVLADMNIPVEMVSGDAVQDDRSYFFPVDQWMDERLRSQKLRPLIRDAFIFLLGLAVSIVSRLKVRKSKRRIFIHEYHPTRALLQHYLECPNVELIQAYYSSHAGLLKFLKERPIPVYGRVSAFRSTSEQILENYRQKRVARFLLPGGVDATKGIEREIEARILGILPRYLRDLKCLLCYLDRNPLDLTVLIANVGQRQMLIDCIAKSRGVPSYLIVNGLLTYDYLDEGTFATVINAYSYSVKRAYFNDATHVFALGDPRMDAYAGMKQRIINRKTPVVTIGASGFNNIDLNSYLAVEFQFLDDILGAFSEVAANGQAFKVNVKVRPNGYIRQYQSFAEEYYPNLEVSFFETTPILELLKRTDLYISIYSQTLLEAGALGIPCLYHKADREYVQAPFDGQSGLVVTSSKKDLVQAFADFLGQNQRFAPFLNRAHLEQFIGPLDGGNLRRNIAAVDLLLAHDFGKSSLAELEKLQA